MCVMILTEEDREDETDENVKTEQMVIELSGLSAEGLTQSNTMKLQGWIEGRRVMVLMDSGASHSFISTSLVNELGLKTTDTRPYKVCLGDGRKKVTVGYCTEVPLKLDSLEVKDKLYFPLN